jgi:hypothetical protein
MSHSHNPLGSWQLDENGIQPRLDRRVLVRSALGAGVATALLGSGSSHALTVEKVPPTVLGAIPPRKGVIPWDDLGQVEIARGQSPRFSAAMMKLNGRKVVIEGHMMVLDDDNPIKRFLLTAYNAHCPYCMPGGFGSVVAIHADHPVPVSDKVLTMRGTLRLLSDTNTQLVYRLEKAVLA